MTASLRAIQVVRATALERAAARSRGRVQTGLATPDSVTKFTDSGDYRLITTATMASFEIVLQQTHEGRAVADYILVYDPL